MSDQTIEYKNRADWMEARRVLGIGSSDAPAILGISRYKSAFGLYQEKLGVEPVSAGESEQMAWGNILEGPIAERYAQETGRPVFDPRTDKGSFVIRRSTTIDFMIAQVDRYTAQEPADPQATYMPVAVPLEIKNAHFFVGKDWLKQTEPPLEFLVQLQHQLAVTGAPWGSIAALIGGCRFVWTDVPRDDEFIEMLIKAEAEFWQRLVDRRPPDPDGSAQATRAINAMFRREATGVIVPIDPSLFDCHIELQDAKVAIKDAETRKASAENKIKLAIGENAGGRFPNGTMYTWKTVNRKEFVSKATSYRQLRPFEPKSNILPAGKRSAALEIDEGMDTQ
jgi:putative phage-type endonuclease